MANKKWPADRIERRKVSELIPYARNARTHSEEQVAQVAASIKEWGWTNPVVIDDDGGIIAGHGRVLAAQKLGIDEVPCAIATGWTAAQKKAYIIADNKLALNAGWDEEMLRVELEELQDEGFNVDLTGFSGKEILALEPTPTVSESDNEAPELKQDAVSQPGEIYELGDHFLMCGDSANPEDVARLMDGKQAQLVFTDPPYGVNQTAKNEMLNKNAGGNRSTSGIKDDEKSPDELKEILLPAFKNIREMVMAHDCTVFITAPQGGGDLGLMFIIMLKEADLQPRHTLIWKKNCPTFSMGRLDYDYAHEPILLTWGQKHKKIMAGDQRTSVWEYDKPRKCDVHPTMKPVELVINALMNNSEPGDTTFDAYCGSGTTLIASAMTNRKCRAMEISPHYCDVIRRRYTKMAKEKGWKLGTGAID